MLRYLRSALLACAAALALGAGTVTVSSAQDAGGAAGGATGSTARSTAGGAAGSAAVAAKPGFQMPLRCGTHWQLNAYGSDHDPALDIVVKDNTGSDGLPVLSSAAGTVAAVYNDAGSGHTIQIKHAGGWFTAYYHLKDKGAAYVAKGDKVTASTQIGRIGKSGGNSGNWSHLHYEQRYLKSGDFTDERHRRPVHFDGVEYTGVGEEWRDVVSKNCSGSAGWKNCPAGSVCFYSGADGTGDVCRTDRDDAGSTCGLRRSYFNNGNVQEGYDHVQVAFKEGGGQCLHQGWEEGRGNFAAGGRTIGSVTWRGEC